MKQVIKVSASYLGDDQAVKVSAVLNIKGYYTLYEQKRRREKVENALYESLRSLGFSAKEVVWK